MSKYNDLRIDILCEDIAHHRFIRKYLEYKGVGKRNIKDFGNLKSHNNGTVLKHYPECVKTYRSKANHQKNITLVVMIDADDKKLEERLRDFDKKLDAKKAELNQKTRDDDEKIAIFVPARNIETWFHYIFGYTDCNEQDDYKKYYTNDDAHKAAEILAKDICPDDLPENALPSLQHACNELKRLQSD
ncbi:MAG: hypothetical protein BWK80_05680 [Desulfobacteraceae bacterium IS3]|nr:MAG: hypothetical protein BWK80_05680 [Desulfobacteraceae bacterium IS3]